MRKFSCILKVVMLVFNCFLGLKEEGISARSGKNPGLCAIGGGITDIMEFLKRLNHEHTKNVCNGKGECTCFWIN